VFPSSVGTLLATGSLRTPLHRALKVAGIHKRLTPHGLRRTLNTLALEVAPWEADSPTIPGAGYRVRTGDLRLGKPSLYQLS